MIRLMLLLAFLASAAGCSVQSPASSRRNTARQWVKQNATNSHWQIADWSEAGVYKGHTSGGKEWMVYVAKFSPSVRFGDHYHDEIPFYFEGDTLKWPFKSEPDAATPPFMDFLHDQLSKDLTKPQPGQEIPAEPLPFTPEYAEQFNKGQ